MINEETLTKIKQQFSNIHPLILHRSIEYASSGGELFDMLYGFPGEYPIIWNSQKNRWEASRNFEFLERREQ